MQSVGQRDVVRKSYEFALNHIGQDRDSGSIWNDYIQLIKSGEVSAPQVVLQNIQPERLPDFNNMGRATKNGRLAQSLSSCCPNTSRQC